MHKYIFVLLLIVSVFTLSCEDNIDNNNPLIGKWRYQTHIGVVETNDSIATTLIKKDIEKINKQKHKIMMYEFMSDSIFILFNTDINSNYKIVGKYYHALTPDTLQFEDSESSYWAIKTNKNYFDVYLQEMSAAYTTDSLLKLGIENPENVIISNIWLTKRYRRI